MRAGVSPMGKTMNAPRIADIAAFALRIPFDHWAPPPTFAGRPRTTLDTVLVRVTTDQGPVGWGEAYGSFWPAVVAAIDHWVGRQRHSPRTR